MHLAQRFQLLQAIQKIGFQKVLKISIGFSFDVNLLPQPVTFHIWEEKYGGCGNNSIGNTIVFVFHWEQTQHPSCRYFASVKNRTT
ncbi:hypothetical protein CEXT_773321 [Caerostris extrusa]|uniref:Uncharacterized protein n=1 Tax=Caerostris extrusa TaxID=172846 RepID=A0AAV4MT11_CAEEX|nr:hypothetical protein CEXT_773321 [Caerostris extrusa]